MYYGGYAYGADKNYDDKHQKAKEKLKNMKREITSSCSERGRCYYTIEFEDKNADVTEEDVIYGITTMCFGGCCDKTAPGVFNVTEYTD
jgi:hypothetical protein